ncbi:MAG: TonB-dependent receptor [Pseudomonadales bacterium]
MKKQARFKLLPLAAAMTTALGAPIAYGQSDNSVFLEEVIVTARKRSESVMDIPSSVQALTGETIKDMNALGLDDYSRFVPSVNVITYGAGNDVIVFRGAAVDDGGYSIQSTASLYVDEISVTNTGSQPSVRMVDIERVEALAGPQGTLYGSDAQAGTMRIITNKPVLDQFEVVLDVSAKDGKESEMSYDGSIVVNAPLIQDKLALRLVGFTAKDGGFIDNVFGHTPDINTGIDHDLPSGFGTLDNHNAVESDWNDAKYKGWRAALRWQINDSWETTLSGMSQEINRGATSDYDPFVGDLQTVRFNNEYRDDEYDLYSLTIEGDLGFAQLISATSYYTRSITDVADNTTYHHHWSGQYCWATDPADYAATDYPGYYPAENGGIVWYGANYCSAPTVDEDYLSAYTFAQEQERITQEFRLTNQGDNFDWLVGIFFEESSNDYEFPWAYPTANENHPEGIDSNTAYQESVSLDSWNWYYDTTFPDATETWYENSSTDWKQEAIFGELVWHISDSLDLTVGGRYFKRTNDQIYWEEHPSTNLIELEDGVEANSGEEKEFVPKVALTWVINDDSMTYGLISKGFRPGGTNRQRGEPALPKHYDPDEMINYELGYKSSFADGAARIVLTGFYMDWKDYQLEIVDPSSAICLDDNGEEDSSIVIPGLCGQVWQSSVANAGDAHILGASVELDWAVSENFIMGFNAQWLEAETDTDLDLDADGEPNIHSGQRLPLSPELTGAVWGTYSWPVQAISGSGYVRLQWSYNGDTINSLEESEFADDNPNPQFTNKAYNMGDLIIGLQGETWEASIFVNNLTDERPEYSHSWGIYEWTQGNAEDGRAHTDRIYTARPREVGLRIIKRWGG